MKVKFHYSPYRCFSGLNKLCRQNYTKKEPHFIRFLTVKERRNDTKTNGKKPK